MTPTIICDLRLPRLRPVSHHETDRPQGDAVHAAARYLAARRDRERERQAMLLAGCITAFLLAAAGLGCLALLRAIIVGG